MSLSRTETIDTLYSSTWVSRLPEVQDNVFNARPFWSWLNTEDRIERIPGGGLHIEEPLEYAENETFGSVGVGGTVSIIPDDPVLLSKWEWRTVAGTLHQYRADRFKNRGKAQIIRMVETKMRNAEKSLTKELTRQVFLDGTGNSGLDIDGLQNIIAEDPTTGTVGGINAATYSWWRNQYRDCSAISFAVDGRDYMSNMLNRCNDGDDHVDLILTSQTLWELYEAELASLQMVVPTEAKRNKIADLGFNVVWFRMVPIMFDKNFPSTITNNMYFINSKTLRLVGSDAEWMELDEWYTVQGSAGDRVAPLVWTLNLTCNNRRRNGVLFDLT